MNQQTLSRRVLVVDDNADAAQLVADFMSLKGYVVAIANGGREALEAAEKFTPDVIFLDIGMPGMDGYEVATALRKAATLPTPRIIALTAWGDAASRERTAACGFNAHLVKPARLESLLSEAILDASPH